MATILAERPLEIRTTECEDTAMEGDFTSDEDMDAQATDLDMDLTSEESIVNVDVASKLVCQEMAPMVELEVEAPTGLDVARGKRFFCRLVGWVIWLLGLAIVLHVCWLAATGGNVGASGLWEVFSLLVVVLAQELLQLMLASHNHPQPVSLSHPPATPEKKKEELEQEESVSETELTMANLKDEEVLKVETAGDTLASDICELNNLLPKASAAKILAKSSREDTPMSDLVLDEMTGSPVVAIGLEGSAVGDVGGGPKTSWGMEVNVLIAQHPTPKMPMPVWDLYAPSDAVSQPPPTLSCPEEGPQATERKSSTLNSLGTPPATPLQPPATDSSPGNIY